MPHTPEIRSVVEAAERAAAEGNYASAETHLREVVRLQEAGLGPSHQDLANTLNNLGVVCEITGKPEDAERCFRRAWAIATTILPPDHPFVATSRKNLEDFCAAHGKAVDSPPPPSTTPPLAAPAVAVEPPIPRTGAAARRPEPSSREAPLQARLERIREAPRPAAGKRPFSLGIGALIAAGLVVTIVAATMWLRSSDQAEPVSQAEPSSQGSRRAAPAENPPPSASPPVEPVAPEASKEADEIAGGTVREPPSTPPARRESPATPASAPPSIVVADARLCVELSTGGREWSCVSTGATVGPGPLFFYTRIKSPTDTTVEHRWYSGDGLIQTVELRVRANTGPGYRTYSRNTIGIERAGTWRVELRTEAGVLLHEERFVVR